MAGKPLYGSLCTATGAVQLAPAAGAPTVLDCPLERELGPSLVDLLSPGTRLRFAEPGQRHGFLGLCLLECGADLRCVIEGASVR